MSNPPHSEAHSSQHLLQLALGNAARSVLLQVVAVGVIVGLGIEAGQLGMSALVGLIGAAVAWSRWSIARRFSRPGALDDPAPRRQVVSHLEVNSLLAGLMWAIGTFGIYTHLQGALSTSYLVFACGSISVAAFFMSLVGRSFSMLALPQLGSVVLVSLLPGPARAPALAGLVVLFGATMYRLATEVSATATRAIRHGLEVDAINERLKTAKEAADAANLAKSQFLATMSHEIRTPMNAVLGSLDLLRHSGLDPDQRRLVKTAASSGQALMGILNDVLDHSKIEAGELQIARAPMSLQGSASAAVNLFRANAQAKGLDLRLDIDEALPDRVLGDQQRLKQVLLNLIGNAIKFTERGEVVLRLGLMGVAQGRAIVRFDVVDTGIGIDAESLARLFQPFQQANAQGRKRTGTGLGLAISQRIVEAMGGQIDVASRPGAGSRFRFELSLALDAGDEDDLIPDSALGALDTPRLSGTVLLVEDNPVNRLIAVQMLQTLGPEVLEVHDGQQAVHALQRYPVDLVLMDCQMPVMDGYTATRTIRERERAEGLSRVPIVALTAEAFDHDLVRARQAGMDAHLAKPYTLADLREVLEVWL